MRYIVLATGDTVEGTMTSGDGIRLYSSYDDLDVFVADVDKMTPAALRRIEEYEDTELIAIYKDLGFRNAEIREQNGTGTWSCSTYFYHLSDADVRLQVQEDEITELQEAIIELIGG